MLAGKLARQTVIGAAALARAEPGDGRVQIARKRNLARRGTTAAALGVLMAANGLQPLLDKALKAATKRAEELSA